MPRDRIAVFSGDGADPAPDLATKESVHHPDFWLLPSGARRYLRPRMLYVNSELAGADLRPATKAALGDWFEDEGEDLGAGDVLLVYVTDHGERNPDDETNNTITLWNETLSVDELRALLGKLDSDVRVVMLMSQCFSGSFANAIFADAEAAEPAPNRCGYFSTTADRPAYGCYPQNLGKDAVGHSHHFFEALAAGEDLRGAHRLALLLDDSPDVPHTTADFYLEEILERAAARRGMQTPELVDEMLAEAWLDRGRWEPEIRLLDRIGHVFGSFSPRTLAELDERARSLPEFSDRLNAYSGRWRSALDSLRAENLRDLVDARAEWQERLTLDALRDLDDAERDSAATELLEDLVEFTRARPERDRRLRSLRDKAEEAAAAAYRVEVRLGVVLRMRAILVSIAGRVYLDRYASVEERETYAGLVACESVPFEVTLRAEAPQPAVFPPLSAEQRTIDAVMPAWMGIRYQALSPEQQDEFQVGRGAAMVYTVYEDSAAAVAGLEVGDVILGPPGEPFAEPHQVREWTMYREVGVSAPLQILRQGKPMRITLRPEPFPLEVPELPGPPRVGSVAPPLEVDVFRGDERLVAERPKLLFFWATWCQICHASLPEVLAFGAARDVQVVAITDEVPATLEKFFDHFEEPFPEIVATDKYRQTFQRYGVSGTPTFVLLDGEGVVRHYQSGYGPDRGLAIEGWHWPVERSRQGG